MISVVAIILVVTLLSLAAMVGAGYVLARHRGEAAADLAALSGAQAVLDRGAAAQAQATACAVAREVASRQQGSLASCQAVAFEGIVGVAVTVTVQVPWPFPGLPSQLTARSYAGNP